MDGPVFQHPAARLIREGRVLWLTMDRPPANMLNLELFAALNDAMETLETSDADLMVISGVKATFSKGFDLDLMHSCRDRGALRGNLVTTNAVFSRVARSSKPIVAAINGYCLGGGLELALCCHFRVCKEKARLGLPEVWNGMLPGLGGIHRLTRHIGAFKALELIALGDLITGEQAVRLNLVNRLIPKATFDADTRAFVRTLLMVEPRAMRALLKVVRRASGPEEDQILDGLEIFRDLAPWFSDGSASRPLEKE